jgi:hypothetical protein
VVGVGPDASISRTLQIKFQKAPRASALFDYGVASKGKIVTAGRAGSSARATRPAAASCRRT